MFEFLRSLFHVHKWSIVFSRMATAERCCIFSNKAFDVPCEMRIEKCDVCGQEQGSIVELDVSTPCDPNFIRALFGVKNDR